MAGKRNGLLLGAIAGAILVAVLGALLGALIRELAHPAILVAFALVGAVLGAYAWGVVAYDAERMSDEPIAGYSEGVLAEPEDAPETGLGWLARSRTGSLLRLPLSPWI